MSLLRRAVLKVFRGIRRRLRNAWAARGGGVQIGRGTVIFSSARVQRFQGGSITLGDGVTVERNALVQSYGGRIEVGRGCALGPNSVVYGHGGLTIGDDTLIAAGVVIIPANHIFTDLDVPIYQQGETRRGITIGSNVWIGANVTILDGVVIGDGAVVAAGAVVRGAVASRAIVGGVPARQLGERRGV